jgi:hypothetical protein
MLDGALDCRWVQGREGWMAQGAGSCAQPGDPPQQGSGPQSSAAPCFMSTRPVRYRYLFSTSPWRFSSAIHFLQGSDSGGVIQQCR